MRRASRLVTAGLATCGYLVVSIVCREAPADSGTRPLLSLRPASAANAFAASEKAAPVASQRVLELLGRIEASLVDSRYSPITRVNPKLGIYQFDCSGMVSWVLQRAAPGAWQSVRAYSATGRLVARDFVRAITAVGVDHPTWTWQRVARVQDAQPGDVIIRKPVLPLPTDGLASNPAGSPRRRS